MPKIRKKKNLNELDIYRITINNILKLDQIKNNEKEKKFYLFLYNDDFNQLKNGLKFVLQKMILIKI